MALRNIHLHGEIGQNFGEVHRLSVETAAEAVRALAIMMPGFGNAIKVGAYHVVRAPKDGSPDLTGVDLDLEMVSTYRLGAGDLHIMPVIAGSKQSGLLKVILGVALVGAAFVFSGGALGTALPLGMSGLNLTYGSMALVGLAVAASGVSSLLSPEQKDEKSTDSYVFSGPQNTYQEGQAIPLVYGEVYTGGVLISVGMDAEDLLQDTDHDDDVDDDDKQTKDDSDLSYNPDPWGHTR